VGLGEKKVLYVYNGLGAEVKHGTKGVLNTQLISVTAIYSYVTQAL
jgi:hypothetical protein